MALPETNDTVDSSLADAGCFSKTNVGLCEWANLLPFLIAYHDKHHPRLKERYSGPGPLPENADAVTPMKTSLGNERRSSSLCQTKTDPRINFRHHQDHHGLKFYRQRTTHFKLSIIILILP